MPVLKRDTGSNEGCQQDKNYFGYAHYNGADSGESYSSVNASIEDYCQWVKDSRTAETDRYKMNYARGQEFAEVNDKFIGTPADNIYVLYSPYAYIGDTHICDDPGDVDKDAFLQNCTDNGNGDGTGGRYAIYYMYELGGLYTGEYETRCGHENATDPTTIEEQADYAQWRVEDKIKVAKMIFGEKAFTMNIFYCEDIVSAAISCHQYLREKNYKYQQAGISIPEGLLNGNTIDCSSYVTWVLYSVGYEEMEGYQQTSLTFKNNPWGWEEVPLENAGPGDIVIYNGHVEIIAEVGTGSRLKVYDCGSNGSISNPGTEELPEAGFSSYPKSSILKILRPSKTE